MAVASSVYAGAAMAFGVFYRGFTRFSGFAERTSLGLVHAHLFLLGVFFWLIVLLLDTNFVMLLHQLSERDRHQA